MIGEQTQIDETSFDQATACITITTVIFLDVSNNNSRSKTVCERGYVRIKCKHVMTNDKTRTLNIAYKLTLKPSYHQGRRFNLALLNLTFTSELYGVFVYKIARTERGVFAEKIG